MCGIYGEFLFNEKIHLASSLERLNHLRHRGPDGFGFESGDFRTGTHRVFHNTDASAGVPEPNGHANYFLGHRRLSINDLSAMASQPMVSLDGNCSITFNGEIYNFIELREELVAAGCSFVTDHSDTEALLNAYLVWGEKCLQKLNGMFAFAIHDRRDNSVFMARDRFGEKPLYYELTPDRFLFASELLPIISVDGGRRLDQKALAGYLTFGYILHPLTIYEGIKKLPPATCVRIDLNRKTAEYRKYWDVPLTEDGARTPDDFVDAVTQTLRSSVMLRLRADVPIGAFISGGTDSTLVAKMIREVRKDRTDLFGADFIDSEHTEREFMEVAARRYEHKLNLIVMDLAKSMNMRNIVSVFDEPFDGGSAIAVFELFRKVRQNYKVILTGDGGDELFAGYPRYANFSKKNDTLRLLKAIPGAEVFLRALSQAGLSTGKVARASEYISSDMVTNYITSRYSFDLAGLLRPGFNLDWFEGISEIRDSVEKSGLSAIKALQYLEMKTILPGRMLYKVDRVSMHYGVEARCPFLDHHLAELAFSIPASYNVTQRTGKAILKKILEKDFDDGFVYREKQGFGNPLDFWFKNAGVNNIFGVLLDDKALIYEYIDRDALHAAFPQIRGGYDGSSTNEIWRLIVLAHFLEINRERIK